MFWGLRRRLWNTGPSAIETSGQKLFLFFLKKLGQKIAKKFEVKVRVPEKSTSNFSTIFHRKHDVFRPNSVPNVTQGSLVNRIFEGLGDVVGARVKARWKLQVQNFYLFILEKIGPKIAKKFEVKVRVPENSTSIFFDDFSSKIGPKSVPNVTKGASKIAF